MKMKTINTRGTMVEATITSVTVGQCFGTAGVVKVGGRVVHRTEVKPYGFTSTAIEDAQRWCAERCAAGGARPVGA